MLPRSSRVWVLLSLLFLLQLVAGTRNAEVQRRQDESSAPPPTSTIEPAPQSTTSGAGEASSVPHSSVASSAASGSDHSRTATITKLPASASASPFPTGITTNGVLNSSTLLNSMCYYSVIGEPVSPVNSLTNLASQQPYQRASSLLNPNSRLDGAFQECS
jgi:hypothetical protein